MPHRLSSFTFVLLFLFQFAFVSNVFGAEQCAYQTANGLRCGDISATDEKDRETECKELCDNSGGVNTGCTLVPNCTPEEPPTVLVNPLGGTTSNPGGTTDFMVLIGNTIKNVLGVVGALTLAVFVYGGYLWLTSAGNEDKVKEGSMAMLYAVVGIFIIFASYGILSLIFTQLTGS